MATRRQKKAAAVDPQAQAYVERMISTMKQHGATPSVSKSAQREVAQRVARAFEGLRPAK